MWITYPTQYKFQLLCFIIFIACTSQVNKCPSTYAPGWHSSRSQWPHHQDLERAYTLWILPTTSSLPFSIPLSLNLFSPLEFFTFSKVFSVLISWLCPDVINPIPPLEEPFQPLVYTFWILEGGILSLNCRRGRKDIGGSSLFQMCSWQFIFFHPPKRLWERNTTYLWLFKDLFESTWGPIW